MVQTQFPLSGGIKGVKAYNTKKEKKYNVTSKPLCTFSTFWEKFPVEMTLEEQESAGGADIGRSIEELRGVVRVGQWVQLHRSILRDF